MPAYEPFLIPHAEDPDCRGIQAGSPIDEERAIGTAPGIWPQLADAVYRSCGLPLLTSLPEGMSPKLPPDGQLHPSPRRFLFLEGQDASWFILEHPSALSLYDRFQRRRQRPALARPSLFLDWLLHASAPVDQGRLVKISHAEPGAALEGFLAHCNDDRKVSDWHLEPVQGGYLSRVRVDGRLTGQTTLPMERGLWLINSVVTAAGLGNHPATVPADGAFSYKDQNGGKVNVRVSLVPTLRGQSMVLRFLNPVKGMLMELDQLGLHSGQVDAITRAWAEPDGLWLLAGPTGAGKSTTLYALLHMAAAAGEKVLTAEDPVEVLLPGLQQVQVNTRKGLSFAVLLKAFMRQAPDTILIGEIRDEETAAVTLQAANSGHRVLGSIHASSSSGVLRRFSDLGQSPGIVRSTCALVIHQRLIPLVCPACCSIRKVPQTLDFLKQLAGPMPDRMAVACGCPRCVGGYSARTGIYAIQIPLETASTREGLLHSAWQHLLGKRTTLDCLRPYFPRLVRSKFTLCHV